MNLKVKIVGSICGILISLLLFGQVSFIDVTSSKGFRNFQPAFEYGCGVTATDYNEDGQIDLYVMSDRNSPNRLYQNNGNGLFSEVDIGVSTDMLSRAALWFDFDGDHLLDLFVAGDCFDQQGSCVDADNMRLFRQLPNGTFEDVSETSGILTGREFTGAFGGISAGDINNDGYLELLTVMWEGDITLYLNNGDGTFSDITWSSGMLNPARYWQPSFFDFDQNGWTDIYLNVDSFENLYWENNQDNTFTEIGSQLNLNLDWDCMGMGLGDFDNDDDMDIYISNILSSSENNALLQNNSEENSLYFNEIGVQAGVGEGGWGWGVTFMEADNDGFLDVAATNGWHANTGFDRSKIWKNKGDGTFDDISVDAGFNENLEASTLISFDYDRDGDLDLAQTLKRDQEGGIRLFENQLNTSEDFGNYLVIKPRMLGSNHWAIGSLVKIRIGTEIQTRPITAGISYYGQEPSEAFFGLGDAIEVDEVTIVWPGGEETIVSSFDANQVMTITDSEELHAPGNLIASQEDNLSIALTWGHMSTNESSFMIERSLLDDFSDLMEISISADSKTYIDEALDPFTTYYYRVRAENSGSTSNFSQIASVMTDSGITINAPSALTGEVISETAVSLLWVDNADNEIGFAVQRSLSSNFNEYVEYDLAENTTSFINSNTEPNTEYHYRVRANGDGSLSDFGNKISLTTVVVLGLKQTEDDVVVYPNPSSDAFQLMFSKDFGDELEVTLINEQGQNISYWHFQNLAEAAQFVYPITGQSGVYFIKIKSARSEVVKRILAD